MFLKQLYSCYFTVFWGGREGYHTLLNTKVYTELSNMANFFKAVVGMSLFNLP